jgi:glutaconate CoA-transferase subunit A
VQGYYGRDHAFYTDYHRATRTADGMVAWLDRWVRGIADRPAYLDAVGRDRWEGLRRLRSAPAAPVDYAW